MTAYLILTSPWGSGDDNAGSRSGGPSQVELHSEIRADQPGAIAAIGKSAAHVTVLSPDQVRPEVRDLLNPQYRPTTRALEGVMRRGSS